MLIEKLLGKLKESNIKVGVVDNKLKVVDEDKNLNPDLLTLLKENRQSLIDFLSNSKDFTVSDFPLANVSEGELSDIAAKYPRMEKLYVATPIQKGMLFEEKSSKANTEYVMQYSSVIRGSLDLSLLRSAWQKLVARHDIFRTAFVGFEWQEIHQLVESSSQVPWQEIDLRNEPQQQQARRIDEFLKNDRQTGFDYAVPPLMRIAILTLADNETLFVWTYHHTLLDGWSIPVILKELLICYEGEMSGNDAFNLLSAFQFEDYVKWLSKQESDEAGNYWKTCIAGISSPTHILTDAPDPSEKDLDERITVKFNEKDSSLLTQLAQGCDTTVFTVIQLAWAQLLSRYSDNNDVLFGTTVSGRPPEIEGIAQIAGVFINTVPIRVTLSEEATIEQTLQSLHKESGRRDKFSYYPLTDIKSISGIGKDNRLFDSLLVFYNLPSKSMAAEQGSAKPAIEIENTQLDQRFNFPLTVKGGVEENCLVFSFEFDQSKYSLAAMQRLANCFRIQLSSLVAANKTDRIKDLWVPKQPALPAAKAATGIDFVGMFARQTAATPHKAAIVWEDEELTYAELDRQSNQFARLLRENGVLGGDRNTPVVAVSLERNFQLIVALLGVLKTGSSYLLLDWNMPVKRNQAFLEEAGAALVVTQTSVADFLPLDGSKVLLVDEKGVRKQLKKQSGDAFADMTVDNLSHKPAFISFVSAAQERPRGIVTKRNSLSVFLHQVRELYSLDELGRVLCASSFTGALFAFEVWAPLVKGGTLLLVNEIYEVLVSSQLKPSIVNIQPEIYRELKTRAYDFTGVKAVNYYGQQPSRSELSELFDRTSVTAAYYFPGIPECTSGPVFTCKSGSFGACTSAAPAVLAVLSRQGYVQDTDMAGELCIGGDLLCDGYFNAPEASKQHFSVIDSTHGQHRVYRSGEWVCVDENGRFAFLGRRDTRINFKGITVELAEIEYRLNTLEHVRSSCVVLRDGGNSDPKLIAYVESDKNTGFSDDFTDNSDYYDAVAECKSLLQDYFPSALVPDFYIFMESLPRFSNGRVDQAALPSPESYKDEMRQYAPPENEFEVQILAFWEKVFQIRDISRHYNFFDLGGTSLQQTRIQANINKTYDLELSIDELFETPTIAGMAELVRIESQ